MAEKESTVKPVVVEAPAVVSGQRGDGGRARGLLAIALATVGVLVVGTSYVMSGRKEAVSHSQIQGLNAPEGNANAPSNAPSQHYKDLVKENNAIRLHDAAVSGNPVVVAPLVGGGDPLPLPGASVRSPSVVVATPRDIKGEVARRVAALGALSKEWNALPDQSVIAGAPRATPREDGGASGVTLSGAHAPVLPLLSVMHAVIDVGANSDYPGELVARLADGPLPGAKFLGHTESSSGISGGADRLTMRFTKMLYKNTFYDVDAIAVDAGTRIPAVKGDIDHHIVHNVVYNAGAAFLLGFAAAARTANPYVGISLGAGAGGVQTVDPYNGRQAVQAAGAQTLATTLQQGQFRGPTVTLPAGSAIGIVLISPARSAAATSLVDVRSLAPRSIPTSGEPARANRSTQLPTAWHGTASDGTPITIGP